mmetsp:Transcript_6451/g.29096  ORF Transcript_6451/g.29096 Transcript_6451/m.29096 type:complete len:285 (-) Transcript_6451:1215-2069(-)
MRCELFVTLRSRLRTKFMPPRTDATTMQPRSSFKAAAASCGVRDSQAAAACSAHAMIKSCTHLLTGYLDLMERSSKQRADTFMMCAGPMPRSKSFTHPMRDNLHLSPILLLDAAVNVRCASRRSIRYAVVSVTCSLLFDGFELMCLSKPSDDAENLAASSIMTSSDNLRLRNCSSLPSTPARVRFFTPATTSSICSKVSAPFLGFSLACTSKTRSAPGAIPNAAIGSPATVSAPMRRNISPATYDAAEAALDDILVNVSFDSASDESMTSPASSKARHLTVSSW